MAADRASRSVTIIGTRIDRLAMGEFLERFERLVTRSAPSHIITANVDTVMEEHGDPSCARIIAGAELVVPDGVPLLWAARFLGTPLPQRLNGTDLMEKICALAAQRGFSVFLLGAEEGIAAQAASNLQRRFPGLHVSGAYAPYHGFENDARENEKICTMLREKKPDVLFLSLGLPKGIQWIDRHLADCGKIVAIEVGSSFMFLSGRMKRAPRWMQKNGLEWLWRLGLEPRRLWKRYLLNDLPFFYLLLKQKYSRSKPRQS